MSANDPMCHLETYYDGWAELVPFHRKQETVACNRLSIGWAPRVVSRDNVMSQLVEVEAMNKRPKTACIIQLYHVGQPTIFTSCRCVRNFGSVVRSESKCAPSQPLYCRVCRWHEYRHIATNIFDQSQHSMFILGLALQQDHLPEPYNNC
jgi:hypothetical protein